MEKHMDYVINYSFCSHFSFWNYQQAGKAGLQHLFQERKHHSHIRFATQQHPEGQVTLWREWAINFKNRGFREHVLPGWKHTFGAKSLALDWGTDLWLSFHRACIFLGLQKSYFTDISATRLAAEKTSKGRVIFMGHIKLGRTQTRLLGFLELSKLILFAQWSPKQGVLSVSSCAKEVQISMFHWDLPWSR